MVDIGDQNGRNCHHQIDDGSTSLTCHQHITSPTSMLPKKCSPFTITLVAVDFLFEADVSYDMNHIQSSFYSLVYSFFRNELFFKNNSSKSRDAFGVIGMDIAWSMLDIGSMADKIPFRTRTRK